MRSLLVWILRVWLRRPKLEPSYPQIARLESALDVPDEQRTVPSWMSLIDEEQR